MGCAHLWSARSFEDVGPGGGKLLLWEISASPLTPCGLSDAAEGESCALGGAVITVMNKYWSLEIRIPNFSLKTRALYHFWKAEIPKHSRAKTYTVLAWGSIPFLKALKTCSTLFLSPPVIQPCWELSGNCCIKTGLTNFVFHFHCCCFLIHQLCPLKTLIQQESF